MTQNTTPSVTEESPSEKVDRLSRRAHEISAQIDALTYERRAISDQIFKIFEENPDLSI